MIVFEIVACLMGYSVGMVATAIIYTQIWKSNHFWYKPCCLLWPFGLPALVVNITLNQVGFYADNKGRWWILKEARTMIESKKKLESTIADQTLLIDTLEQKFKELGIK